MFPVDASHKKGHSAAADSILPGYFSLSGPIGDHSANLKNLRLRQLGLNVLLAARGICSKAGRRCVTVASLASAIGVVLGPRAEEQVAGVTAWRVVATVTHAHTAWDWTVRKGIGSPVCRKIWPVRNRELSVATPAGASRPWPALVAGADVNLRPKSSSPFFVNHRELIFAR